MINVSDLSLRQGGFAISGVSFTVTRGAYAVLMGPTGCGKTSVLEALCGLRPLRSGTIQLNGVDITHAPPAARGIGYVPQDGALFPTMSVGRQIGFALRLRGVRRPARRKRVAELAELMAISALLTRPPRGLSGGEVQRVALARALAHQPAVLCLDEPLSALDEANRDAMAQLIRRAREAEGFTALHVTHSGSEAEHLATQRLHMRAGRINAAATPASESTPVSANPSVS